VSAASRAHLRNGSQFFSRPAGAGFGMTTRLPVLFASLPKPDAKRLHLTVKPTKAPLSTRGGVPLLLTTGLGSP